MAHDAVTGPLVQSCWLSPIRALHQPWVSVPGTPRFQEKDFSLHLSPGWWAEQHPHIPHSRGPAIQTLIPSSVGHGPAGPPGGSAQGYKAGTAPGEGLRAGGTGCSGGGGPTCPVSPAPAASARPDAGSPAMLACSPMLLCRGRAGTWERCHHPGPWGSQGPPGPLRRGELPQVRGRAGQNSCADQ